MVCECVTCKRNKAFLYLIFAKDITLGNAEQQGIGNLASSAGHQNSDRLRLQDTSTGQQLEPLTLWAQV